MMQQPQPQQQQQQQQLPQHPQMIHHPYPPVRGSSYVVIAPTAWPPNGVPPSSMTMPPFPFYFSTPQYILVAPHMTPLSHTFTASNSQGYNLTTTTTTTTTTNTNMPATQGTPQGIFTFHDSSNPSFTMQQTQPQPQSRTGTLLDIVSPAVDMAPVNPSFRPSCSTPSPAMTGTNDTSGVVSESQASSTEQETPSDNTLPYNAIKAVTAQQPSVESAYACLPSMPQPSQRRHGNDWKWLASFEQLKQYKQTFGDCIVPRGFSPNIRLARWVAEQRYVHTML
jgi:hypothetical protein